MKLNIDYMLKLSLIFITLGELVIFTKIIYLIVFERKFNLRHLLLSYKVYFFNYYFSFILFYLLL